MLFFGGGAAARSPPAVAPVQCASSGMALRYQTSSYRVGFRLCSRVSDLLTCADYTLDEVRHQVLRYSLFSVFTAARLPLDVMLDHRRSRPFSPGVEIEEHLAEKFRRRVDERGLDSMVGYTIPFAVVNAFFPNRLNSSTSRAARVRQRWLSFVFTAVPGYIFPGLLECAGCLTPAFALSRAAGDLDPYLTRAVCFSATTMQMFVVATYFFVFQQAFHCCLRHPRLALRR